VLVRHAHQSGGDGDRDLHGGARRVCRDGAVLQGGELVLEIGVQILLRNGGEEVVRIHVRDGGHGEDLSGVHIHDDARGAAGVAQGVFEQILDGGVDGELHLRPAAGLGVVRHADGAALLILDDLFLSLRSQQVLVHRRFHAGDSLVVADVVVELPHGAFRDVAFFPFGDVAEHVAGEGTVGIVTLGTETQIDAGKVEIVLGEFGELLVGEIGTVAEGDQSAVGDIVGAELLGIVGSRKVQLRCGENPDRAVPDDGDDVFFHALAGHAVFLGEFFDLGILVLGEVGLADLVEIEGYLVVADVLGEGDAVAVGDLATDAGFTHGDGAVAGDLLEEIVAVDDLKLVKPRQQATEADENEGGEQVEPEAVAGFHIRRSGGVFSSLPRD
jgi:hypothetical protein